MRSFKKFIINGIVMTCTSLLLRWVGVMFNTYLSGKLGSEGMGVYSLVQSVFGFAVTFAYSGVNLGATRLISEALAKNRTREAISALKKCICYALFFSFIALIVVFCFAEPIGVGLLGDSRTIKAIRVLACCLPFMALSSVFSGYFSAVRRVYKNAGSVILEQAVQIAVTIRLITLVASESVEAACTAVAVGTLVSEIASFLYNLLLCSLDACSLKNKYNDIDPKLIKKLLGISLPIAFSTYIRSGLLTVEHLLIPYGLRKNGASYSSSMSTYGLVQGMVFPIIMFPSCIIYSFAGLLVPELAAYNERKEQAKIDKAVSMVIKYALAFSIGVAGVLVCYSYELSMAFYNSAEAYEYIRLFAPLVTVMYLDGAVDGLLKGLNQQLHSMKINIADALLSVFFVYLLIPSMGVRGYVLTVFICEIFNCGMSLTRLVKISSPSISVKEYVLKPIIGIVLSSSAVVYGFDAFGGTVFDSTANLVFRIALTFALYLLFVFWKDIKRKKSRPPVKPVACTAPIRG